MLIGSLKTKANGGGLKLKQTFVGEEWLRNERLITSAWEANCRIELNSSC